MFTLLIETSGQSGMSSQCLPTTLRVGDEVLWKDGELEFYRRLTSEELPCYRRLRRTTLAQLIVQTPQGRRGALALRIARDVDACAAMIVEYGTVFPELQRWHWAQLGLLECLPSRQRFRVCSRPA